MKKYYIIYALFFALTNLAAQEFTVKEKSLTSIIKTKIKEKSKIFSSINKWIALNYNSANHVIQMNDKESGTIIVKGINKIIYKNITKTIYPKNRFVPEFIPLSFNHVIEINVKEGKYRVVYKLINIQTKDVGYNRIVFNTINLKKNDPVLISEYSTFVESIWKKGWIGKKKRASMRELINPMFEEISSKLLNDMKLTINSINNTLNLKESDDW